MIRLITFSDDKMTKSAELCCESAMQNGVDYTQSCTPEHIDDHFKVVNSDIWLKERGPSYWLWKPYIIYKTIMLSEENDVIIYSDAGIKWIANVNEIISRMDQDLFLFSNGHQHVHWCKMDVLAAINGMYLDLVARTDGTRFTKCNDSFLQFHQAQASVIFIKVNQNTRNFIKEWLLFCQFPGFIDDSPSKLPNHPEFAEHRHDQAILTCLAIKYSYRLHWWADALWYESQRYRWADDTYPSMWEHHRKRDPGKGGGKNPEW